LALGATFNRSLWSMVGAVIGLEGRALQNENAGGGVAYFVSSQAIAIQLDPNNHRRCAIACEWTCADSLWTYRRSAIACDLTDCLRFILWFHRRLT
jgi:hypothetical protein